MKNLCNKYHNSMKAKLKVKNIYAIISFCPIKEEMALASKSYQKDLPS